MATIQLLAPATGDRQRGIDRLIALLDALMRLRTPTRAGDLVREIGAPRSTVYEIVNRLLAADILEPVGEFCPSRSFSPMSRARAPRAFP
jgi:DNA-binding IclR family transcriptional regulator